VNILKYKSRLTVITCTSDSSTDTWRNAMTILFTCKLLIIQGPFFQRPISTCLQPKFKHAHLHLATRATKLRSVHMLSYYCCKWKRDIYEVVKEVEPQSVYFASVWMVIISDFFWGQNLSSFHITIVEVGWLANELKLLKQVDSCLVPSWVVVVE